MAEHLMTTHKKSTLFLFKCSCGLEKYFDTAKQEEHYRTTHKRATNATETLESPNRAKPGRVARVNYTNSNE